MSLSTSTRFILRILEDLDSAISLSCAIMLKAGNVAGILSISIDPGNYIDAGAYFRDVQALALFKKRKDLVLPGIDRRSSALNKWWEGEHQCYESNERLSKYSFPSMLDGQDLKVLSFINKIRLKITSWIGPKPPSLDNIEGRFGPGATFSDRGRLTTVPDKMSSTPTLTHDAFWYILPYLQTKWGRINQESHVGLDQVRGNRFAVVPKTALIDRCIAVEPSINLFFQLGLGSSIRRRLQKATGWDLDHAQDIHRLMAEKSSIDRKFCTIDLSNASDTVCYELVRLVMPPDWFRELNALRSPSTFVDGHWVKLEKFSSMGNGFTFELETLIFSAILSVLLEGEGALGRLGVDLFVFGDDIILPTDLDRSVVAVLRFFGFTINETKSFFNGHPFRESCGADFFLGNNVRPFYLKDAVNDPFELIPTINGIRRLYNRLRTFGYCGRDNGWYHLLDTVPSHIRQCRGPVDLGDSVIHDENPENWRFKWKFGIRYFRSVSRVNKALPWKHWRPDVVLASALYGTGDGFLGVTPRDSPYSYTLKWVPHS